MLTWTIAGSNFLWILWVDLHIQKSELTSSQVFCHCFVCLFCFVFITSNACTIPKLFLMMRNSLGNKIWSIYNAKYSKMWTLFTPCVSVAISGDFCHETAGKCTKFTCLAFELFAMNATPARRVTPPWDVYMANCHPGWQGYPTWQTYHLSPIM